MLGGQAAGAQLWPVENNPPRAQPAPVVQNEQFTNAEHPARPDPGSLGEAEHSDGGPGGVAHGVHGQLDAGERLAGGHPPLLHPSQHPALLGATPEPYRARGCRDYGGQAHLLLFYFLFGKETLHFLVLIYK